MEKLQSERTRSRLTGVPKSDEHKRKLSEATNMCVYQEVQCPNCGKFGAKNAMKRWHFQNCKYALVAQW